MQEIGLNYRVLEHKKGRKEKGHYLRICSPEYLGGRVVLIRILATGYLSEGKDGQYFKIFTAFFFSQSLTQSYYTLLVCTLTKVQSEHIT